MEFSRTYTVRWADLDPNGHMRHSAYTDYAAQLRIEFLAAHGYTLADFARLRLGPILFREDTRFLKELHLGEALRVDGQLGSLNADGSRWRIIHTLYRADGRVAATVTVDGAWLDLDRRKLAVPPAELAQVMRGLDPHESFGKQEKEGAG